MSINFDNPINDEAREFMRKMIADRCISEPAAEDGKTFLVDGRIKIKASEMSELSRKAKQPVTVELNDIGEIKELSDGTRYEVTHKGWRKAV